MTNFEKVKQFHREVVKYFLMPSTPTLIYREYANLRMELISEEEGEFFHAIDIAYKKKTAVTSLELSEIADSLADLLYVVYGAADYFGINIDEVFDEVHRSNMTKKDGPVREDGKILKGLNFEPPRIQEIIEIQMNTSKTQNAP